MNQFKCEVCQTVPDKFVCLDCDHKFCLTCLAKLYKQHENFICCYACQYETILDEETINALLIAKLQSLQPPTIIPYSANKRKFSQKESLIVKGHPFLEKLNVSIEKCFDYIRGIQFDKQQIREQSNKYKSDLENAFKQIHDLLDEKHEQFMNQISKFEINNLENLQMQEENYQINIKEMQLMKDEIKSLLHQNLNDDIEQFKILLNQVDEVSIRSNQGYQSNLQSISEHYYNLSNQWVDFSKSMKQFLSQQESTQINQFITATRLEQIQKSLISTVSTTNVKPIKHQSNFSLCSPPRTSFLNEDISIHRKSSRIDLKQRMQSPGDTRLNSIQKRNYKTVIPNLNLAGITFIK